MDDFFTKQLSCKLCESEFEALVARKSKQPVLKADSDFCTHYEREIPFYYNIFVCPRCSYAFLESFKKPTDQIQEKLKNNLKPLEGDFSGRRDHDLAEKAFLQVIEVAKLQREGDTVLASLYLQLAWIYRFRGDEESEKAMLEEALNYYADVYEKSDLEDVSKVLFLLGELNRRLGRAKEAVFWFSKVANDEACSEAMRHRARQAWQGLRR